MTVWSGLVLAIVAGLILNIMPCVLPIIPLRVFSLVQIAGDISFCLAKGGNLILSGILNSQGQAVLAAYRSRGLILRRRIQLGDWTTLVIGS